MAVVNYQELKGHYPPAYVADTTGRPLLSWRVLILPYMDQQKLYSQFKLDEPWDSPHNKRLLPQMPKVFRLHTRTSGKDTSTNYVAVVGKETIWGGAEPRKPEFVTDGASNTLMISEFVGHEIPWTKPEDLVFSKMDMTVDSDKGICSELTPPAFVSADGIVRFLPKSTPAKEVRSLLTANSGDQSPQLEARQDGRLRSRKSE